MNIERMKRLREVLLNVDKRRFDMSVWEKTNDCGTVACAVGWACMDPVLMQQGLHLTGPGDRGFSSRIPAFEHLISWPAVARFFGIPYEDAEWLFDRDGYDGVRPGPREVVARMDEFIAMYTDS